MNSKRRNFLKNTSLVATGALLISPEKIFAKKLSAKVKIAMIGVGLRGQNHLALLLRRTDVELVAICDVNPRMLASAQKMIDNAGVTKPQVFTGNNLAYQQLFEKIKGLDGVIIATPWEWHKPMIMDALNAGIKYIGTEVILGISVKDHWDVVYAAEKAKANVMMLENVCYRRDVMAAMNMVRQGLFGELIHLQGGYQHDLRTVKFSRGDSPDGVGVDFGPNAFSEARWRTAHSVNRNGDLYPTHGIGPLAMMIDINRGNRFLRLSSYATKSRGLHKYIVDHGGETHPNAKVKFNLGDIVTTQIQCANGESILLQHDTNNPRPYSLGFRVQGTNGIWMDVNKSIYIEGKSAKDDVWENQDEWFEKYDHPLWKRWSDDTKGAGHGGMDFFVLHGFIEAIKINASTPMDVYDAATWSVITPLSELSIAEKNKSVDFPDFTNGGWQNRHNDFAQNDEY